MKQTYSNLYRQDVYARPVKLAWSKNKWLLTAKTKNKQEKVFSILSETKILELLNEHFPKQGEYSGETETDLARFVTETFENNKKYVRIVADEDNKTLFISSLRFVPLTRDTIRKTVKTILEQQNLLGTYDPNHKKIIKSNGMMFPLDISPSPETKKITGGEIPYLIIEPGNNFRSRVIQVGFGMVIQVCSNGLIATKFFGKKAKIKRISKISGFIDEDKRKEFFSRFRREIIGLVKALTKHKEQFDTQIQKSNNITLSKDAQSEFIENIKPAKYVKKYLEERLKEEENTIWGLSQCITWVASHRKMRSDKTVEYLQVLGGKIITDIDYVKKVIDLEAH